MNWQKNRKCCSIIGPPPHHRQHVCRKCTQENRMIPCRSNPRRKSIRSLICISTDLPGPHLLLENHEPTHTQKNVPSLNYLFSNSNKHIYRILFLTASGAYWSTFAISPPDQFSEWYWQAFAWFSSSTYSFLHRLQILFVILDWEANNIFPVERHAGATTAGW